MGRRLIFLTVLGGILAACGPGGVERKSDYVENVEVRLVEVSMRADQLQSLRTEALESGAESDPRLEEALKDLDRKQQHAEAKLQEVKRASVTAWRNVRVAMDKSLDELEQSCDVATILLEEVWFNARESGLTRRYLLVSYGGSERPFVA